MKWNIQLRCIAFHVYNNYTEENNSYFQNGFIKKSFEETKKLNHSHDDLHQLGSIEETPSGCNTEETTNHSRSNGPNPAPFPNGYDIFYQRHEEAFDLQASRDRVKRVMRAERIITMMSRLEDVYKRQLEDEHYEVLEDIHNQWLKLKDRLENL